jgi:probable HAF family extracellular repeat protein
MASCAPQAALRVFSPIDVPGARDTRAFGINDHGGIVGLYQDTAFKLHGFLFSGGSYSPIDFPGAPITEAWGINGVGQIVGFYEDTAFKDHGFLLAQGRFTTIDVPTARFTLARGINNLSNSIRQPGQIVGDFSFEGSTNLPTFGFLLSQSVSPRRPAKFSRILSLSAPRRPGPLGSTTTARSWVRLW